ncbi:MAG: efflux RND transporter permease subunit [Reyranella sp.]|nr:efflux RND transporter permease subunit [Reyranella sp.]
MLKAILAFGLTRRPIIVLGVLVFLGFGVFAFSRLNIEAYPNPAPVILEITAQAPGLSAEEMEKYYTIPIEVGLYPTPGVVNVRSTSFYGLSFVRVTFRYGIDFNTAYANAAVYMQQRVNLPGTQVPQIQQSSLVGEILRYQITGPPYFGLTNLRTVGDWIVTRRLLTIPGVVAINPWGGTTKQFNVNVDLGKLEAYNLTIPQIVTALGNANINVGGREISLGQQSVNIRGVGLIDDGGNNDLTQGHRVTDIENIVLSQTNGVPVTIRDVAKVEVGYVPRLGIAGRDHDPDIVAGIVVMGRTQHTNEVLPKVEAEIERMNSDGTLPRGVKLVPYYDRATLVNVTTATVVHNLVFGCLLVFLIQWIFLGDLRSAIIVGANIPFALFFAVVIMVARDEDANLLSVGAVDFGIIIDSAVILVENIFRNFQSSPDARRELLQHLAEGFWGPDPSSPTAARAEHRRWTERLRLIFVSALQVDRAVFFTALITVTAFLPLFTMSGVEGQIFGPMARTYAYALAGALLATFTVTPVLASIVLPEQVHEVETAVVRYLRRIYTVALRWSLAHVGPTLAIGAAFLIASGLLATRLGTEFLPALEEGNLWIRAAMPPSIDLPSGVAASAKMRDIMLRHPEVLTVVSQHGRPDDGSDASPFSNVELFAPLKPFKEWPSGLDKEGLINILKKEFAAELPGITFAFSQYIQDNVEEALSGVKGANSIKILGPDLGVQEELAEKVFAEISQVRGITDTGIFHVMGQPNLNIRTDRERAARYGLNSGDINTVVQAAMGGTSATTVLEGERQFGVSVRLADPYRNTVNNIGDVKVGFSNPNGGNSYVPLKEVASIGVEIGPSYIYRESTARYIPIKFAVRGRDLGSTVAEAQERVQKNVPLPQGYRIIWSGEFENLEKAKRRLEIIIPVTLVLILALLYALFNTLRDSLVALAGIPFAVGGGVIALWITGEDFSVSAAIGFISLAGVSVMDGILILTYFRELLARGLSFEEAIFQSSEQRMRPMLMTALSAAVGLFPAAISHDIGSQVQRPLATVVVGGLLLGPLFLLVVVPALRKISLRAYRPDPEREANPAE